MTPPAARSARDVWRRGLPGAVVFATATILALLFAPSVSIWTDEAVTISAATRSFDELWALLQRIDAVHALYYAGMALWTDVFGVSPLALRVPSALAAGACALGAYALTRLLASPTTALLAGLLTATIPRITWGGIEARPFIFSAAAAVWATFLLMRALQRRTRGAWVAYTAVAVLGILTNIYLVMVVATHVLTVLLRARRDRFSVVGVLLSGAAAGLASLPLLLLVRSQQAQLGGEGDRSAVSILRKILVNQVFLGETPDAGSAPAWFGAAWQGAAVAAALLGLTAITLAVLRPAAAGDRKADLLAATLPWLILPTVLVAGYAVVAAPIYQPRYFTFTAPAAAILIAVGVRTLSRRWVAVAGLAVYLVCVSVVFASQRIPFAKSGSDWSAAAYVVAAAAAPGDAVYFAPRDEVPTGEEVTLTTRRIAQSYPAAFAALDDLTLLRTGADTATLDGFSRPLGDGVLPDGVDRVWALYTLNAPDGVFEQSDAVFAAQGFRGTVRWDGPTTRVVEYERID